MLKPTGTLDTLAVSCRLRQRPPAGPPIVLLHGAANSAGVWTFWQHELARLGYASYAIDLRGHGDSAPADLSNTTMDDYASDVRHLVAQMARPPVIMGWSMGGLAALMAAAPRGVAACVCLEPSLPVLEIGQVFAAAEWRLRT